LSIAYSSSPGKISSDISCKPADSDYVNACQDANFTSVGFATSNQNGVKET